MATWEEQLKIAETIFQRMASTEGKLEQSITEWRETLQNAENAGMMKNIKQSIIGVLQPAGLEIRQCMKDLREIDRFYIIRTINTIAKLGNLSTPNTEVLWNTSFNKGKDFTKKEIKRNPYSYGDWNDFEAQILMLTDIHSTIEFIQEHINVIKMQYSRFEYDIREMKFMKQYVDKVSQHCIQPRIATFTKIHSLLDTPKKIILNKKLELNMAKSCE